MRSQYTAIMDYLTEKWSSSQFCNGEVEGCSEEEIAEIMQNQSVKRLPLMYIEFLLHMGRNTGGLQQHFGSEITYPSAATFKPMTFNFLRRPEFFVFTHDYQGDCAIYFHITEDDDPILYWVGYEYSPDANTSGIPILETQERDRLSDFLTDLIDNIVEGHKPPE